jgi:2-oxoisovalerate dehydrogenase E1 component
MKKTVKTGPATAAPGKTECLKLYEQMVLLRQFELAAQKNYKAGRMPGFIHLYVGEEAVGVGVCANLRKQDCITSTHRGHGHALAKGLSPRSLMAELYGRATGCCGGRGGSMHLFDPAIGLFGTNGIVGGGLPAAVGAALGAKVRGQGNVVVAFFGDGAVNHGAFHESVNFATAQQVPLVFVCENNLYATATPFRVATRQTSVAARAAAYGLPGVEVDGNDVLAVREVARQAVERARQRQGPTLIEAKTYRTVGHHEGDPVAGVYRTEQEVEEWKGRCPIRRFRGWLQAEGFASDKELADLENRVKEQVEDAVAFAESSPRPDPATANDHVLANPVNPAIALESSQPAGGSVEMNYLEAVRDGIAEEMRRDPHILYFGEGIGERGGSFAHTKGLWQEFGGGRVIDTPISELGFTGAAAGASATGCRTVSDMMFIDFLFDASSQVILQAAKWRYMSGGQASAPVVIRASMGAIKNAGPHHSGCYYPIYAHCPGLIVVVPSNAADAKGLMKSALRAHDPVIFLEHKLLFGGKGPVPSGEYYIPFGQANMLRRGSDLTIVSCGEYVNRCLAAAKELERQGLSCEIVDLRTLVPLDTQTILASVAKTRRLLVVDEAYSMCGVGAEIAALVMEEAFDELDAPVGRLHPDPVTQPFAPALEDSIVVSVEKIIAAAKAVVAGKPMVPRRLGGAKGSVPAAPASAIPRIESAPKPVSRPAAPTVSAALPGLPVVMPNQDLTVTEGTVVRWLKQVGDSVKLNEVIVEVETAKAIVPVESPAAGRLVEILAKEGVTVQMSQPLGTVQPG